MLLHEKIIDSLPVSMALLDRNGEILHVNENWRKFARENGLLYSGYGVGKNYISICNGSKGESCVNAALAGEEIRKVLSGEKSTFSLEYPCHSTEEKRWFKMLVSSLEDEGEIKAVVMHIDITKRVLAEKKYKRLSHRLRALAIYMEKIREKEKQAISKDIRENIGQSLAAIKLMFHLIKRKLKYKDEETITRINELNSLISSLIRKIQEITDSISPDGLETLGLINALEKYTSELKDKETPVISFTSGAEELKLNKATETGIFRLFQEVMDFILGYSTADYLSAIVNRSGESLLIRVVHNGKYRDGGNDKDLISLTKMAIKERALSMDGRLRIKNTGDKETEIEILIPV